MSCQSTLKSEAINIPYLYSVVR
eukprot:Gb_11869 [translate_table: standard]